VYTTYEHFGKKLIYLQTAKVWQAGLTLTVYTSTFLPTLCMHTKPAHCYGIHLHQLLHSVRKYVIVVFNSLIIKKLYIHCHATVIKYLKSINKFVPGILDFCGLVCTYVCVSVYESSFVLSLFLYCIIPWRLKKKLDLARINERKYNTMLLMSHFVSSLTSYSRY